MNDMLNNYDVTNKLAQKLYYTIVAIALSALLISCNTGANQVAIDDNNNLAHSPTITPLHEETESYAEFKNCVTLSYSKSLASMVTIHYFSTRN